MTGRDRPVIVWFRDDLRIADNRALRAAAETGLPVLAIYVYDEDSAGLRPLGAASRWWLHHALAALGDELMKLGGRLTIFAGAAGEIVPRLARETSASSVYWSRRYGAAERAVDTAVKAALREAGVEAQSCNDHLLSEPWELKTQSGGSFKVFTPFSRALSARSAPAAPLKPPTRITPADPLVSKSLRPVPLDALALLPSQPDWAGGLRETWTPGEAGAKTQLAHFVRNALKGYGDGRDRPDLAATSRLSPHLRFGEISPRHVWHAVRQAADAGRVPHDDAEKFLSEIAWREFSYHLLFHHPDLATRNFNASFDTFPWRRDAKALRAWQIGATGIPIVDAGMRELWHSGVMHNRVRMIVASFLIKHLLIDWRQGETWFWDTLVDADPANNAASWQWVAGSGADAAPYFRIFNPVLQGTKSDPAGDYVRRWVPELAKLPAPHIHKPWEAPAAVLVAAGVVLGKTYPNPIVDLDEGRTRALAAFKRLRGGQE